MKGRRVMPNVISQDLFNKVDFYKHSGEEETKKRYPWLSRAKVQTSNNQ